MQCCCLTMLAERKADKAYTDWKEPFSAFEGWISGQKKDKSAYCTNIPPDTTEEVLRAIFPECINVLIPTNEEGENFG